MMPCLCEIQPCPVWAEIQLLPEEVEPCKAVA